MTTLLGWWIQRPDTRHRILQKWLNAALIGWSDQGIIALRYGEDFESEQGSVLYMTRDRGMHELVELARSGADETSVTFIPALNTWIVDATARARDEVYYNESYAIAAARAGWDVEFWHTHNIEEDEPCKDEAERRERELRYSIPSPRDYNSMCEFAATCSEGRFKGVVAGVLGALEFWADEYPKPQSLPRRNGGFSPLSSRKRKRCPMQRESDRLESVVGSVHPSDLESVVAEFRGIFRYKFTRVS